VRPADDPPAPADRPRPREIPALTGLRFPITFAVLLLHLAGGTAAAPAGGARVPLFFVLSGFVMAAAYYPRPGRGLPAAAFCARRFARLYPLLLFTSLPAAFWFYRDLVLPAWHGGHAGPAFLRGVAVGLGTTLFPPAYLSSLVSAMPNGYAWFVMVELSAGLLFPACARLVWRLGPAQFALAAAGLPVAACVFWTTVGPRVPPLVIPGVGRCEFGGTPLVWLLVLTFGAAMHRLYVAVDRSPAPRRAFGRLATPLAGVAVWLVYLDLPYAAPPAGPAIVYCQLGLTLVAVAVSDGWAARLLSTPPLMYLGRRSYSIYMMAAPVFLYLTLDAVGPRRFAGRGVPGSLAWVGITIVLGLAAYRYVEAPCKGWMGARLGRLADRWDARGGAGPLARPAREP
jgi:peptidoglycan/LPS O-acetylase OafA/YrhL